MQRVLVVGPLPSQQRMLEREFPALDLRFVSCNENDVRVRNIAPFCSHVVVWVNYVTHKQLHGLHKPTLVRGGMSSLRAALARIG
jgi:hypothetical protein